MRRVPLFLLGLLVLTLVVGCKPGIPGQYLQPGEMEDILYDYHIARAINSSNYEDDDTLTTHVYKLAVLKKYGVSEADYDSSLVYYTRHSALLRDVYEKLSKRLSNEALALGASASEVNQYTALSNTGDTANIWTGDRSFILSQHDGFNVYSFTVVADTAFKPGDRFVLGFNTQFIYQDGMRDAVALIALTFSNDSVISRMTRMSSDNLYKLDISDNERLGIKKITGYFVLNKNHNNDSQTTLKLMHVDRISLIRMHAAPLVEKEEEVTGNNAELQPQKADSDSVAKPSREADHPVGPPLPREADPLPLPAKRRITR